MPNETLGTLLNERSFRYIEMPNGTPSHQIAAADLRDIKGRRFLILSAVFPPDVIGGAEISARDLAKWLQKQGAEVGVLTTAKSKDEVCSGAEIDGLQTWRVWMPRPYPMIHFSKAKWWQKPLWHLQDHFDPRNRKIVARVLEEFKPDFVNIQVLQGLGYNALAEIAKRSVPVTYVLHDLALACFRMAMFKNGKECDGQCTLCKISSTHKLNQVGKLPDLGFCSPSQANMDRLEHYFPVKKWRHAALMNPSYYPPPTVARSEAAFFRILYVGRLHASKGVQVLLSALENLAGSHKFKVTIVGSGPDESSLRKKYGHLPWCEFTGYITQQEISNYIMNSDILCLPSIWAEPLGGGAIVHALGLGVPVLASDKGGIPELIEHNKNGLLIPPNDIEAWKNALERVLDDPSQLAKWRNYALENVYKFDPDYLGEKMLGFICKDSASG